MLLWNIRKIIYEPVKRPFKPSMKFVALISTIPDKIVKIQGIKLLEKLKTGNWITKLNWTSSIVQIKCINNRKRYVSGEKSSNAPTTSKIIEHIKYVMSIDSSILIRKK